MAPGIAYDDSGSLASYFGVTFLAFVLVPATYLTLKPANKDAPKPLVYGATWDTTAHDNAKAKTRQKSNRLWRRIIPLVLGWALFAGLAYLIYITPRPQGQSIYNPFEILGITDSSTEKQIKKHYKKLAIQFHPDKIQLAENQTKEDAEAKFVELTKAYKSLTDEAIRENLAKYGNPDGPQQREDKIAIPKWVVEGKGSVWVLALYGIILGGVIPFVVGRWWFAQRSITRDGILNTTAEHFFHYLREDTDYISLISLLAGAHEYVLLLAGKRGGSKKERKERQARIDELQNALSAQCAHVGFEPDPTMQKESEVGVSSAAGKRARALLFAHLLRYDLDDDELRDEQLSVLLATPVLVNALLNISLSHNWLTVSRNIVNLQAAFIQAVPPTSSPLEQLPGITHEQAQELEVVEGADGKLWIEKAVKRDLLPAEAKAVAETFPRLEITNAKFTVDGEELITPGSIVSLTFNVRYRFPTSPPTSAASLNGNVKVKDETPDVVISAEDEKTSAKEQGKKQTLPNGYIHAPHWPQLRKPYYQVLLGDSKLNKIIIQPSRITDIPLPLADGTLPEPKEVVLQFQAPPEANLFSFVLYAFSESFLGSDVAHPIMMTVSNPPADDEESEDEQDDDDISEPEEDSLAGQMAMMRGAKVKPSAVHGPNYNDEDEDSESEYEYEYESSSDEEGPRTLAAKKASKGRQGKAINEDSSSDED